MNRVLMGVDSPNLGLALGEGKSAGQAGWVTLGWIQAPGWDRERDWDP